MEKSFVSLIFSIRRDADLAESILVSLDEFLNTRFELFEIIVVCNGASVSAKALKSRTTQLTSTIHFLQLGRHESFETAMLVGLDKAIGDFIYVFEEPKCDFPLSKLGHMLDELRQGQDVVFLSPPISSLKLFTRVFYFLFNRVSSIRQPLKPARVLLLSRRALNFALDLNHLIRFHRILFLMSGFKYQYLDFKPEMKSAGRFEEKTLADQLLLAKDLLLYYSILGRQLSLVGALGFGMLSVFIVIYAVYSYFFVSQLVSGWTSLMLFLAIAFTGIFGLLGIFGEYLGKILASKQGAPIYLLESVESNLKVNQIKQKTG